MRPVEPIEPQPIAPVHEHHQPFGRPVRQEDIHFLPRSAAIGHAQPRTVVVGHLVTKRLGLLGPAGRIVFCLGNVGCIGKGVIKIHIILRRAALDNERSR